MSVIRLCTAAAFASATLIPTIAIAADEEWNQYEVNNGDGTCYTVSCNQYGCSVIDVHYCPREVSGG